MTAPAEWFAAARNERPPGPEVTIARYVRRRYDACLLASGLTPEVFAQRCQEQLHARWPDGVPPAHAPLAYSPPGPLEKAWAMGRVARHARPGPDRRDVRGIDSWWRSLAHDPLFLARISE